MICTKAKLFATVIGLSYWSSMMISIRCNAGSKHIIAPWRYLALIIQSFRGIVSPDTSQYYVRNGHQPIIIIGCYWLLRRSWDIVCSDKVILLMFYKNSIADIYIVAII